MKQWVTYNLWRFRPKAGKGGHLFLRNHVQTVCGAHPYPMGTERKKASLSGATAAEYEVNYSPKAGESSLWAAVSILYIFVLVCTNSQIQVFRRVRLYKFALIIPASCVWRANVFTREYSGAAVFRKISLFKSALFQILSSWHKKEKKKKRAFKAAAVFWKYMFESWTTERRFCSLFKCKETILLASVLHWLQKTTSDVRIR
jgi:hypothetical protein